MVRHFGEIQIDRSQAKCLADVVMLYIRYALNDLGIHNKLTLEYAEKLHRNFVRGEIIGNPRVVAAAVVYITVVMRGEFTTQEDIAQSLKVSHMSLRKKYKEIKKLGRL